MMTRPHDSNESAIFYSEDAEQAVVAAILIESLALRVVRPRLRPTDFFALRHQRIYSAIIALADRGDAIDPHTLSAELERHGALAEAGGKEYIGFLIDAVPTAANVEYHAAIVVERAQRRAISQRADTMAQAARDSTISPTEIARAERAALDGFLAAVDGETLPSATRAIDAPPPRPVEWLIEDLWPRAEIGLIVGDGGSFKSSAAIHIAGAVAAGEPVFGRFATSPAPVLVVSAEDDQDTVLMRLNAFVTGERWDAAEVLDRVHVVADPDATIADTRWQQHILREVLRVGAGLVLLDPLAELIDGEESSNSEMRPFVKYTRSLARKSGAAVGIIHHAGKAGEGRRLIDRIRGASAFASAARTILFFDYQPDGVRVSNIKNSRAPKLEAFTIRPWVQSSPGNRAHWLSARLACIGEGGAAATNPDVGVTVSRGAAFVLAQVQASPRCLGSVDLKTAAAGTGIRAQDVSAAIASLEQAGMIAFEAGLRGKKLWFATLPSPSGIVDQMTLPTLPEACPGRVGPCPPDPAHPLKVGRVGMVDERDSRVGKAEK